MILLEPSSTPYDWNWRLGSIPVRVHPMFWVIAALLGWSAMEHGFQFLLLWMGCVFVSILVHELGHVLMGQVFGTSGHIILYSFGGLAVGSNDLYSRWQRIAVSFAGPLAGFLLFGAILAALAVFDPARLQFELWMLGSIIGLKPSDPTVILPFFREFVQPSLYSEAVSDLLSINLFWGLFNLLPIYPLDGGQISREFFRWLMPERGLRISLAVSLVLAGLIALNSLAEAMGNKLIPWLYAGGNYTAMLFGMLALQNFFELQEVSTGRRRRMGCDDDANERMPWEQDPDYWKSGRDPWAGR